jgi:predicted nuclease of predicted toxin-antitoxin system
MKFKLDENLPREATEALLVAGHDAVSVLDQGLGGKADEDVFAVVTAEGRAIVTLDLGFGNIRSYRPETAHGIVVLRLGSQSKPAVLAAMETMLSALDTEPLVGKLWVVEEGRVRVRGAS